LTSVKEYFTPGGNEELLDLLKTHGDAALIVVGGVLCMAWMPEIS